ncbi:carbon-nitrogen family hydrolase (macronuclear) [Tetrahymena thermophila SB210]|uniref:Carbon-nitrogen family hydrolase n=1 Tax=Tetrahymena thermophila (strain SB210) TaxID=312017 RepID=I7MGL2_TETTS|nr:carbon-nitrogen family hydrolase [Tetrahymena thermophila SB210]EAR85279.1 carbon-nitrogen family hydrolase [Tetrahymena thermophila SB210]|eukprot:XP_001032942.1 carbon-nitrogen family hydrolase [Tetrahymena thermophila SB210]
MEEIQDIQQQPQETQQKEEQSVQKQTIKMIKRKLQLKALIYQINPNYKQIKQNIQKVESALMKYNKNDKIDIFMLPEMALTGYTFKDRDDIRDYCEESGKGKQFTFFSKIATKLGCYVFAGFPEIEIVNGQENFYNSAYLIDRDGKLIITYRKKHLFETDKTWAQEGSEFGAVYLKTREGKQFKAGLGICMDINPYEFQDSSKFEFSDFCKEQDVDVVLFLSAWNDHEPDNLDDSSIDGSLNYWLWRMRTMQNKKQELNYHKSWAFICCDRTGVEDKLDNKEKTHYLGCSCVIKVNPTQLVYCLDKKNEGVLVADISLE